MPGKQTFTATIQDTDGGGAFVEVPFDVEKEFGSKRPKIKAMIEGVPYRGTLTRMGTDCHILGICKNIRKQIGRTFGDEITIVIEPDTEPRVVEIPMDLENAFRLEKEAQALFQKLSYTHQKEYVTWIDEAKKEETRRNRIAKTIEILKERRKTG